MTPEERQLLEKTYRLSAENNVILRKMHRKEQWNSIFRWVYWIIILVLAYYSYLMLEPYLRQLQDLTGSIGAMGESASSYSDLLKQLSGQ